MGCVRKRGKSWNAQVRLAGWRSFTKTFPSKSDANSWVNELERKLRSAHTPETKPSRKILIKELIKRYVSDISPTHKGVIPETYRLNAISRTWVGDLDVRYLTNTHFNEYRDWRLRKVSNGTVRSELAMLKRVIETAKRRWDCSIPYNPLTEIEFPPSSRPRNRRLRGDEKERLLVAASSQKNIYVKPIIEFAVETGMRRSEILKLLWEDIDFEKRFALLYDTKNGEDRRVPLTRQCMKVLETIRKPSGSVFPIAENCIRLAWERVRSKAGIIDLRFHDLRHEAVSRFFEMGMSVPEVALISGHKDVRQLLRYTHLSPESLKNKYEAFQ